jgi:hypothetical protein
LLCICKRILNRTIIGLIAIFLAGISQISAQVNLHLSAPTPPPIQSAEPHPAQKEVMTPASLPAACDAFGDKAAGPAAHSVTLSWNASVPASVLARDAVIGYIVYRSTKPHDPGAPPINIRRLTDTACVDTQVSPGEIYYYVTRAVSASGALSGPSNQVRVQIPAYVPVSKK